MGQRLKVFLPFSLYIAWKYNILQFWLSFILFAGIDGAELLEISLSRFIFLISLFFACSSLFKDLSYSMELYPIGSSPFFVDSLRSFFRIFRYLMCHPLHQTTNLTLSKHFEWSNYPHHGQSPDSPRGRLLVFGCPLKYPLHKIQLYWLFSFCSCLRSIQSPSSRKPSLFVL